MRKGLIIDVKRYPQTFDDILRSFFDGERFDIARDVCEMVKYGGELDTEKVFHILYNEKGYSCSKVNIYKTLQRLDRIGVIYYKKRYGFITRSPRFRNILQEYINIYNVYFLLD